jgi:voltage-gated potassium channel Kch
MSEIRFKDRLRYTFDNLTSRGPGAMIGMLFILAVILVLAVTSLVVITDSAPEGIGSIKVAWMGLMRTLDAGTMGGDEGPAPFLGAMLAVTVGGIFVVGTLIGIITNGIDAKLEQMRKGRSFVAEEDHTIILGWSSHIFTVISELVEANANRRHACIAVLADKDKVEMEDEIRGNVPIMKTTRVVCRTGSPMDMSDLEIVNHSGSRSIIILPPECEDADSAVIKTVLALVNNPKRRTIRPYHIVGVLHSKEHLKVVEMVGGDEVQLILAGDLIARISAQTCRQSGLSLVYTELLDFGGDEIYFSEIPAMTGREFGDVLMAFEDSAVIGIRKADGATLLNPPMDTLMAAGDSVIAIAEDDDRIKPSGVALPPVQTDLIRAAPPVQTGSERTIILGYNSRVPILIRELDGYVGPGSTVHLVAEAEDELRLAGMAGGKLENLSVTVSEGSTTDRTLLDSLDLGNCHHVIIQSYSDRMSAQNADARTLITLLHLRNIRETRKFGFSIVSEMMDDRNRELVEVTQADDFIVSDKLISLMLTQISENRQLKGVFADLFDPEGSEVYLKPVEHFVATGSQTTFYAVVEAARRRGEVAIGYRSASLSHDPESAHGVVVNPAKSEPLTFRPGDKVVVLAEN